MLQKIGLILLISLVIYLGTALILILTNRPLPQENLANKSLNFDSLISEDYQNLPELQPYKTRDESKLYFRLYESETRAEKVLILLHGSGWHSLQFYSLAEYISSNGIAHVITPDLRGHGFTPEHRGDVDYIGQLEDDLADLIKVVRERYPDAMLILGGHSSGGGLVIRFAGSSYANEADAYLLLAPFLKYNAPTTRANSGGWARPLSRRIAGLSMLNNLGITWLNQLTVIQFSMPQKVLDSPLGESAVTAYSYRLNTSFAPRNQFEKDLSKIKQPFLLAAGLDDEAFIAEQYETTISPYTGSGKYVLLENTGHINLLTNPEMQTILADWLNNLDQ